MSAPTFTPEQFRSLLTSLPSDRTTLTMVVSLARAENPGLRETTIVDTVFAARDAGEVEFHKHPEVQGKLVIFTPLGAERAGVRLNDDSSQWEPVGGGMQPYFIPASLIDSEGLVWRQHDRRTPEPLDRVISLDDQDSSDAAPAWPILLGLSCPNPFPTHKVDPNDCPLHRGRLPKYYKEYCLYCDAFEGRTPDATRPPRVVRPPE